MEDASSAFERPAWAVEKMVAEGKLERRVDADGRVFVRKPPSIEALADALAPLLPDEVIPIVMTEVEEGDERGSPEHLPAIPSREEQILRALWKLLEKQQAQIAEIRCLAAAAHADRARLTASSRTRRPDAPAPARRSDARASLAVLGTILLSFALGVGWLAHESNVLERERSERALEHAEWMTRRLVEERRGVASVASGQTAFVATTTLAAGFRR